jgi:coproporphyrinogen III oxidase
MPADLHDRAVEFFRSLQERICTALAHFDGKSFREDLWNYASGRGGGRTRVWVEGGVFEKAGVNFSAVEGEFPEDFAKTMPGSGRAFRASGVSLVLHPWNPKLPTVHANFRHIQKGDAGWFGGGADLTPYYPYREDCVHFHRVWRSACARHQKVADYDKFKRWCDEYFYLPHRQEARGVGGVFFDHLTDEPEAVFAFVQDAGNQFLPAYLPIAERRKNEPYTEAERDFQLFRRGRYVEFNLVYDRGTLFGLKTGGRTESILMSLPLNVRWLYDWQPAPGSWEAELYRCLEPRDWVADPPFGR